MSPSESIYGHPNALVNVVLTALDLVKPGRLDPDSVTPLYQQLFELLRGQIERGELKGRMPSVKDLQDTYGVAQGTAERAYSMLREKGLATSGQGRGHFVVPPAERPRQPGDRRGRSRRDD